MRIIIHKTLWGKLRRAKKVTRLEQERLEKYHTGDFLKMAIRLAQLTAISFWRRHMLASRLIALILLLILLFSIAYQMFDSKKRVEHYDVSGSVARLLTEPVNYYADKLKLERAESAYVYNKDYKPGSGVTGDSASPKISAKFSTNSDRTVTINDPQNEVSISFIPTFTTANPLNDANRVIYPIPSKGVTKVYSLGASGVKEDIILREKPGYDELSLSYSVELSDGLELRLLQNGGVGVYGVATHLLGNVTTGSDDDAALLQKARQNGEKSQLIFAIPAPIVLESDRKTISSSAKSRFVVEQNKLVIETTGLQKANYPLSIDPTVFVESARQLMRGNNETNTDFDVDNELIQKSQTTGARIDSWGSTTNLSTAVWAQGTAVAGGYIYSAGGGGGDSTVTSTFYTDGTDTYTVPSGVTQVTVKVWGAGGGAGAGNGESGTGGDGGGGGYAKAVISVTPSETLDITVGSGGAGAAGSRRGGDGGGFSAVNRSTTVLLKAAGGGGGGGAEGSSSGDGGDGGAGGGTSGLAGGNGENSGFGGGGQPGTSSAGGSGGSAGTNGAAGAAGAANAGGDGGGSTGTCNAAITGTGGAGGTGGGGDGGDDTSSCEGGGGGGGGYYGGGGGGSVNSNNRGAGGGGGGSSYINPTGLVGGTDINQAGSGVTPGSSADADRNGAGLGATGATSTTGATGADGGVVITYTISSAATTDEVSWARFNSSTNAIESPDPESDGVPCSGWCTEADYYLPSARKGLSLVTYNGYLYAIGGVNSSGIPQTSVYIAKLGANGEPQLWHPTDSDKSNWVYWYEDTALTNARSQFGAVAYKNRMYIVGGLTTSTTILTSNTVQSASIRPNGTLSAFSSTGMQALSTTASGNRYGLTLQVYNDTLYVLGGNATFSGTPETDVDYSKLNSDGSMNAWVATEAMAGSGRLSVGGSFSAIFGGYIYVNGGCTTVNASGYCTAIAADVQLTSINADGSLAGWNTMLNLSNDRFAHTLIAWQGGLYRLGGCRTQNSGTGVCTDPVFEVEYGVINPDGEASTVATSSISGAAPCSGSTPYNCDLPSASVGNMLNATAIVNGYLYIMGGCTNNACTTYSRGVTYQAIASDGTLERPSSCGGTYTDAYCVSNESLPSALGAPGVAVFNNRIYVVGGFPTISNIFYVSVNSDGSLGEWQNNNTNTGTTTDADLVSYTFAYARANPASAGSNPGNLYIIGGCSTDNGGSIASVGCSGYSSDVYKCNITSTGTVTGCTTTGQLQIGTVTGNDDLPTDGGLGAFAGAVYANYIYLMGGLSDSTAASGNTNGLDLTYVRYARFDDSNNIVAVSGGDWVEGPNEMITGRRRGSGFGYNGYLYVLGGYDGADAIADIEFAKINVSDGSWGAFDQSSVTIQKRWALTTVVSNSYAYVVGGCILGQAPSSCTSRTNTIQTFQIYNNDSGTPVDYSAATNLFTTDRMGAGTAIYNGYIYIAGGCVSTASDCADATDNVQYASLDAYGTIGSWANTTDATLPGERAHGKLLEAGGTLYWVGGQNDAGTAQSAVYYATPSSNGDIASWNTATNGLPAARSQIGAAEWNDRLYVTGGVNAGTTQSTVYYSPSLASGGNITATWTSSTAFDVARSGHTTVAYANNLYVFGGYDGTNYLNDAQYTQINTDGSVDAWTFTTALPTPLRQADGFAANGYLYLVGGRTNDSTCASKTLVTPISANTTVASGNNPTGVGEWFETNVKYDGSRYAASVSYADGKYYVLGGACNGFPTVKDRLTQSFSANTTHNVTMPATVNAGDLLLVLMSNDDVDTVTDPDGAGAWTQIGNQVGTGVQGSVWGKVAVGDEDGTNVNFATGTSETAAVHVYRIPVGEWSGVITDVEDAPLGTGSVNNPNPAALNPAGWATENTLWIAFAAGSSYSSTNDYPTDYTSGAYVANATTTADASVSSAWRQNAVASEDPGAFAMGNTTNSVAFTIGVRPAGYELTGSNRVVQTAVYSQPQLAIYSRLIDTDTNVFPNAWLLNGIDNSIGARWQAEYYSAVDASNVIHQQSFDDGINGNPVTEGNSAYDNCYRNAPMTNNYSSAQYVTPGLSMRMEVASGINGNAGCQDDFDATTVRYDRFYVYFDSFATLSDNTAIYSVRNEAANDTIAQLRIMGSGADQGKLQLRDKVTQSGSLSTALSAGTWHRIEVALYQDDIYVRIYEGASLHSTTPTQTMQDTNLSNATVDDFDRIAVGVIEMVDATWGMYIDEHVASSSNWVGPAFREWGETTSVRDIIPGDVMSYVPLAAVFDAGTITQSGTTVTGTGTGWTSDLIGGTITYQDGTTSTVSAVASRTSMTVTNSKTIASAQTYSISNIDTQFARWYFVSVNIDASRTFGYPEDVNRGPTITDLSLFFTADPNKRLRHGKTFTGGEQQPLDTPCRQTVDAECPLP